VPQSAFYDVLSSRPRSFSTDARRSFSTDTVDDAVTIEYEPEMPKPDFELGGIWESLRVKTKHSQMADRLEATQSSEDEVRAARRTLEQDSKVEEQERGVEDTNVSNEGQGSDENARHYLDPISPFLDGELPAYAESPGSMVEPKKHEALRPHAVAPSDRSKRLSNLHRAATAPRSVITATEVYDTYTNTYFSATSGQSLTPSELRGVAGQLSRLQSDPRRLDDSTQHYKRTDEIVQHLRATSNAEEEFAERMKLRVRPTTVSKTSEAYVDELSRGMEKVLALRGDRALDEIKPDIDFFLRALVDSAYGRSRFDAWWSRLTEAGPELDGHSYKTRLLFLLRSERADEIKEMIQSVLHSSMDNKIALLNAAMAMYAEEQRWDIVSGIYTSVFPSSTVSTVAPLDNPLQTFKTPACLRPDKHSRVSSTPSLTLDTSFPV